MTSMIKRLHSWRALMFLLTSRSSGGGLNGSNAIDQENGIAILLENGVELWKD